jgi:hypothetical protein
VSENKPKAFGGYVKGKSPFVVSGNNDGCFVPSPPTTTSIKINYKPFSETIEELKRNGRLEQAIRDATRKMVRKMLDDHHFFTHTPTAYTIGQQVDVAGVAMVIHSIIEVEPTQLAAGGTAPCWRVEVRPINND